LLLLDYGDDGRDEKDPVFTLVATKSIGCDDHNSIFLIDHSFTFKTETIRKDLTENPALSSRLSIMMGVENNVDTIIKNVWRYANFYSVNAGLSVEDSLALWYLNDEVGSAILHSDEPNFRMVPFIQLPQQITYSLLFPIKNVDEGDQITRDYIENVTENRDLLMLPWQDEDFSDESFEQSEPDDSYFLHGRVEESLPENAIEPIIDRNEPLKVFSDYEFVTKYLTDPSFEITSESENAHILWMTKHFKGFSELSKNYPNTFVNQFPFENVLTIKDLLAIVSRRSIKQHHDEDTLETYPRWLPTTYNLKTELREFISYYQNREAKELDNYWIIKPFNLARSLDTSITNNLSQIIRLSQTGPKIAQKYIERPVLFDRIDAGGKVKFDVRYVILLSSVKPLKLHIYRNFFLRFSNIPFSMSEFDVYEKHFTVMNYGENLVLKHIKCEDFVSLWKEQYENYSWDGIEDEICEMLKEVYENATKRKPPCGIAENLQSRGLYACDIMLCHDKNDKIQPKLLEINFVPDMKRACEYYNDCYNDIFKLLFLGEENEKVFRRIA
jgi:tubulin--tyrosine ligase-like protein 12